ncbi:MAG: hypothetical protein HC876_01725 [Chloroflexaceae bacterium]|nr:hypothetical protein [Chloroflexaceae bacterium]NJO04345.1 hypothetical protein [Chloroflexaceae bacterium]
MVDLNSDGQTLFLNVNGGIVFLIILAFGAWVGWQRGIRVLLTVAITTAFAYLIFVSGAEPLIAFINRIYSNLPYFTALVTGQSLASVSPFPPAFDNIPDIALLVRVVGFVGLVGLGLALNTSRQPWYGVPKSQVNRWLGAFTGGLIATMWINALTVFWLDYVSQQGNPGGWINAVFSVLPDVRTLVPLLIGVFVALIIVTVTLNFPKALKP